MWRYSLPRAAGPSDSASRLAERENAGEDGRNRFDSRHSADFLCKTCPRWDLEILRVQRAAPRVDRELGRARAPEQAEEGDLSREPWSFSLCLAFIRVRSALRTTIFSLNTRTRASDAEQCHRATGSFSVQLGRTGTFGLRRHVASIRRTDIFSKRRRRSRACGRAMSKR
jgi:hypothetical protein